jgi:hypothetical protein
MVSLSRAGTHSLPALQIHTQLNEQLA